MTLAVAEALNPNKPNLITKTQFISEAHVMLGYGGVEFMGFYKENGSVSQGLGL